MKQKSFIQKLILFIRISFGVGKLGLNLIHIYVYRLGGLDHLPIDQSLHHCDDLGDDWEAKNRQEAHLRIAFTIL